MSSRNSPYQIAPIRWPVRKLEDTQSVHKSIKNCDRLTACLSIACDLDANLDKTQFVHKTIKLYKKVKYSAHLKVYKHPLYTANNMNRLVSGIKRLNTTRGLKLYCLNSNITSRISQFTVLKPLIHFNHLHTVNLHIFFVKNARLFEKFGRLVQSFRAKNLNIKEPLAFMPERYIKRFYFKIQDSGRRLDSLKLSNHAPFTGPLEKFAPYKFLEKTVDLKEINLSFVGIAARNSFLSNLTSLIAKSKSLSSISLNLSLNQISSLEDLNSLESLPLEKIELNFSHCPLNEMSFLHLANFLYSIPGLKSLKLILCSIQIDGKSLRLLLNAINSLKDLTSLTLSLNENRCIDTSTLHTFFSQLFSNPNLISIELGLARAFIGGFLSDSPIVTLSRKPALRRLDIDLSNNKLKDKEMALITQFCQGYTDLEDLKISLENCQLGEKAALAVWTWISTLKKLRSLEISLLFSEISYLSLYTLLNTLLQMKLINLILDLTDVVESKDSAEVIWLAILAMKDLKYFKVCSSLLKQALPKDFVNITQRQLPNCSKFEICA